MKKTYYYDKKLKKVVELGQKRPEIAPKIHLIKDIEPYIDENMGHEPVYVRSRRHKMQLLKERRLGIK